MSVSYSERLVTRIRQCRSPLVVGLDPRLEQLPLILSDLAQGNLQQQAEAYRLFCNSVIDAVADIVPAVKPQFAFFEELGPDGMVALHSVCQYAKAKGLVVLGDAKRGDIGSTAIAYANAYLAESGPWGLDALTVNPYMGRDTLQPFLNIGASNQAGLFVLVKTSNPGSGDLQDLMVGDTPISQQVASWLANLASESAAQGRGYQGMTDIGAVVGATYPQQLETMRQQMPGVWILIPGFGAQGGSAADTQAGFLENGLGALVNSSRGVIFAFDKTEQSDQWIDAVRQAAIDSSEMLRQNTPAGNL